MESLGQQYDEILTQIKKAQASQTMQQADGRQINRGTLFRLYEERDRLLDKINTYGRNYIEGQNTAPMKDTSLVSF